MRLEADQNDEHVSPAMWSTAEAATPTGAARINEKQERTF